MLPDQSVHQGLTEPHLEEMTPHPGRTAPTLPGQSSIRTTPACHGDRMAPPVHHRSLLFFRLTYLLFFSHLCRRLDVYLPTSQPICQAGVLTIPPDRQR